MDMKEPIPLNLKDPHELETLFRKDPEGFRQALTLALEEDPTEPILRVWQERLHYEADGPTRSKSAKSLLQALGLAVFGAIFTRILFQMVEQGWLTPITLIFGTAPFMATYFLLKNRPRKAWTLGVLSLFLLAGVYINLLPKGNGDANLLAYLHLPVFLWFLVGAAYLGGDLQGTRNRIGFLKFNGEFAVLYGTMAASGILLTGLTFSIFGLAGIDITEFYQNNIILFGVSSLAVLATHLVSDSLKLARNILPFIARIFAPLVFLTLVAYLVVVVFTGANPFLDRDFLLSGNGILLFVLALTIFSITERRPDEGRTPSDILNVALILLALLIDLVALAAIFFRVSSYGITPNRTAVLGVNLLVFLHLVRILLAYVGFLRNKTGPLPVQEEVTRYLPVYGLWAAFVVTLFPWLFR